MKAHLEARRSPLRLPRPLRASLEEWALAEYPREACGLLLGRREDLCTEVSAVRRARNLEVARSGERFDLDPRDHLAAEDEARARGLAVVGLWHTHPDRAAEPSPADRAQAWSGWSYVILAVAMSGVHGLRSWRLVGERFVEEDLLP